MSKFQNHELQTYMALFLSRPQLYECVLTAQPNMKQNVFFKRFHIFLDKYYKFNYEKEQETLMYFGCMYAYRAGEMDVAGGGSTNAGRKQLLQDFNQSQENVSRFIRLFQNKYGITVSNENDQRVFVGHKMPWLNPSPALLEQTGWAWVANQCYDDTTMTAPMPEVVDPALVPLAIRNVVYQKWMKARKSDFVNTRLQTINVDADADELAYLAKCGVAETKGTEPTPTVIIDEALLEDW
jgi:hypothetical protein